MANPLRCVWCGEIHWEILAPGIVVLMVLCGLASGLFVLVT